ncbi:MAG: DUF192 domain-containing protein [Patescibacteria group bacterium]
MNLKKLIIFLIILIVAVVATEYIWADGPKVVLPNGFVVNVEIADTDELRYRGFSGTEEIADNQGMLFLFSDKKLRSFVMRDMKLSIDMIWVDGNTIVGFEQGLQPEDPVETLHESSVPINRVLEVKSGFVDNHGVKVGDILDIRFE